MFLLCFIGVSVTGFLQNNQELEEHGKPEMGFASYIVSPHFGEAIFENFESEFLQMGALVVLTIWLVQKGAPDSKKLHAKESVDTSSRYSIINASNGKSRMKAIGQALYGNSLAIALFSLFAISFILHAISGVAAANQEALLHKAPTMSLGEYMVSSQFWFESFQNWQSEFMSVGVLIVLSIFLRQRKSPESKAVADANTKTGS